MDTEDYRFKSISKSENSATSTPRRYKSISNSENNARSDNNRDIKVYQKKEKVKEVRVKDEKKDRVRQAVLFSMLHDIGDMPAGEAAARAGIPATTHPKQLTAYKSIQERIEAACSAVEVSIQKNVQRLGKIAYKEDQQASDSISAIKEINRMAGWYAPAQVDVNHHQSGSISILVDALQSGKASLNEIVQDAEYKEVKGD